MAEGTPVVYSQVVSGPDISEEDTKQIKVIDTCLIQTF